ncbi:MAG: tRNA (5-methylaminomethyl-2-thiouridine)(34)-methyltransferase MnmD [Bacteroidota bacterium]
MNLKIINTDDGSSTLFSSEFNDHYHSVFGAINESKHVFIDAGLKYLNKNLIKIFEVGFGTGLNSLLTCLESSKQNINIEYTAVELYPVSRDIVKKLNYTSYLIPQAKEIFEKIHQAEWNKKVDLSNQFQLKKIEADFNQFTFTEKYDLIYFDAFGPEKQPDLWSIENFTKLYLALNQQGILTTYSSKGFVKQNLKNAGFKIQRLPGPTGKRHMIRAIKE